MESDTGHRALPQLSWRQSCFKSPPAEDIKMIKFRSAQVVRADAHSDAREQEAEEQTRYP